MVLLVERLSKLYSKLENHHNHPQPEALSASLQAFRSDVSSFITQLLNSDPGLETLSLEWIQKCFQILPMINKAFAKLVVEIDYHVRKWKAKTMEEYLKYSLDLLDLLNSFSSALSHLGQARLSLSHALSLVESSPSSAVERLKTIEFMSFTKEFKDQENKIDESKERSWSDKEWVILQALMELRSTGFWVCSIVLAGLCGDDRAYLAMRKSSGALSNPTLINLDSSVCGVIMGEGCVLKEVRELKDSADCLVEAIAGESSSDAAAEEMRRKLEEFEKLLDGLGKEVDRLFFELLAGRNELLDCIRLQKP
ncbi:hypothetical protein P3X46_013202 [Hevea brasiliensis]|uniref:Rx N-terminal domain-containing protein n=1 Tax=Hevea brasiliensis TaxID=3981 RepID=A0ABQ9M525_HEVBR|nr:uncharacterized protein LOC110667991 [Hevea brasiliensis]KAJ9174567.1 hypothetical protein P3X46_013202 [Hevea brasiliensis]